jgi:hypothetical protein
MEIVKNPRIVISYIVASALMVYTWVALVPAAFMSDLSNPANFATLGGVVAVAAFIVMSFWPSKDPRLAKALFAMVLTSMPVFYLWAAVRSGTQQDVLVEIAGLVIFGGISIYGYLKSPVFLGLGILAHGLCWDSWHHNHALFFEGWYPSACMTFDIAAGIVVIARYSAAQNAKGAGANLSSAS